MVSGVIEAVKTKKNNSFTFVTPVSTSKCTKITFYQFFKPIYFVFFKKIVSYNQINNIETLVLLQHIVLYINVYCLLCIYIQTAKYIVK